MGGGGALVLGAGEWDNLLVNMEWASHTTGLLLRHPPMKMWNKILMTFRSTPLSPSVDLIVNINISFLNQQCPID